MKKRKASRDIKVVMREFIQGLREALTDDQIKEVVKRNATPEYKGCCATHDFLDANMVMLEATTKAGIPDFTGRGLNTPEADYAFDVINTAWDKAKDIKFDMRKIDA